MTTRKLKKSYLKIDSVETSEMTFIRNISGSTDQNSFTGAIKANDVMFDSDYSQEFWGVLALDIESLCQFIINPERKIQVTTDMNPGAILSKLNELNKEKPIENEDSAKEALKALSQSFPETEYLNKKQMTVPS